MEKVDLPIKALSVRQPWAWLIVSGHKDFENRSIAAMRSMHEGYIAIHASKGMTRDEYLEARLYAQMNGVKLPPPDELVRGAIIGEACVVAKAYDRPSDNPWAFSTGMHLEYMRKLFTPIPCSGQLGFFKWSESGEIANPKPWMIRDGKAMRAE